MDRRWLPLTEMPASESRPYQEMAGARHRLQDAFRFGSG